MISAALTKLLNSAASEAGKKAWETLKGILGRHRHPVPEPPTTPEGITALANDLAMAAEQNHDLARDLHSWHQSVSGSGNVTTNVSGNDNKTVAGRDLSNVNITFN
jgi:hypothetical protein